MALSSGSQGGRPGEILRSPDTSIAINPGEAETTFLSRGQYRLQLRVMFDEPPGESATEAQFLQQGMFRIATEAELKRIYIFKADVMPPQDNGEQLVTAIFRVVDNPIWLPSIIATLGAVIGGTVVYSSLDAVEGYTEGGQDILRSLSLAAAVISILWFFNR